MPRDYTPRPAPARFLDSDCPREVLAIYDDTREPCERFTVIYKTPIVPGCYGRAVFGFRGMSENPSHPQGVGMFGEIGAHDLARFRERNRRFRAKWSDLPEAVRVCVLSDCEGAGE